MQSLINEIEDVSKFKENLENPFALTRKSINSYHAAYKSLYENNNKRVVLIRISMWLFYIALEGCVVFSWYLHIFYFSEAEGVKLNDKERPTRSPYFA